MQRVYLAGRFQASDGARLVDERDLPGVQGRLVAAYLVLRRAGPATRDELADVVWPDELPPSWEGSLRALVSKVRAALRPVMGGCGDSRRAKEPAAVSLELPPGIEVDVERAAMAAHLAETALRDGDHRLAGSEALVASLIAARGFLPGVPGAWADDQRADLQRIRVRALDCLGEVWLRSGDPAEAARDAERLIALDPFHEGAVRRLMRAHAAAGERARALQTFEDASRRFHAELGVGPDAETRRVRDEIAGGA